MSIGKKSSITINIYFWINKKKNKNEFNGKIESTSFDLKFNTYIFWMLKKILIISFMYVYLWITGYNRHCNDCMIKYL